MIIDSHVHIGGKGLFSMKEEEVLYSMNEYKIDISMVSNADSTETDFNHKLIPMDLQESQYSSTIKALNFARANKGRIYVLPWIRPLQEKPTKVFKNLIEENLDLIKGLKIHPFHSSIRITDERVMPYIELAMTYNLPIEVHTAKDDYSSVKYVEEIARKYPEVNFIMVHLGLETDNAEAIEVCKRNKNIYGDTTWVPIESTIRFVKSVGSHKLLFGSDNPIDGPNTYKYNKNRDKSLYQLYFNELKDLIPKDDYENIMFKSAQTLFRI